MHNSLRSGTQAPAAKAPETPVARATWTAPAEGQATSKAVSLRLGYDGRARAEVPDPVAGADAVGTAHHASAQQASVGDQDGDAGRMEGQQVPC